MPHPVGRPEDQPLVTVADQLLSASPCQTGSLAAPRHEVLAKSLSEVRAPKGGRFPAAGDLGGFVP